MRFSTLLLATILSSSLLAGDVKKQSSQGGVQSTEPSDFELTIRKENGAYGTAAYSFRFSTQELQTHRNQVDLVYNRCGYLHVNAHGAMRNRIVDLGSVDFEAEHDVPKAGWNVRSIKPEKQHVYVQEINDGKQTAYVKFKVADVEQDGTLKVRWSPLGAVGQWPQFRGGGAGTMGQCGGAHQER